MNLFSKLIRWLSLLAVFGVAFPGSGLAQDYVAPRTSFGAPDLQGVYSIATVTNLERGPQFNGKLVISEEEVARIGQTGESYLKDLTSNVNENGETVGGYNTFVRSRSSAKPH